MHTLLASALFTAPPLPPSQPKLSSLLPHLRLRDSVKQQFPLTTSCMCIPVHHPQAQCLLPSHYVLLLLYLNVVLHVYDVVLGCLSVVARSALLRSQDVVTRLPHILESDRSFICQSASAIYTFSVNHYTPVPPPSLSFSFGPIVSIKELSELLQPNLIVGIIC